LKTAPLLSTHKGVTQAVIETSYDDFMTFVDIIFRKSFDNFVTGDHIIRTCELLQKNKWTMRLSARDHFKSTALYALLMWKLWRLKRYPHDEEWKYFSYKTGMAKYHMSEEPGKLKYLIRRNEFFTDIVDLKPTAEFLHRYTWDDKHFLSIAPMGLKSFGRGTHCYGVIVDDPFQDPENKMKLTDIYKINDRIKSNIIDMPHENGELHIAGTAQTTEDFFFDKEFRGEFAFVQQPAISSWKEQSVLWREWQPWERLMRKRRLQGEKIFNQEYLCSPAYSEDAFFTQEQILGVTNPDLENLPINEKRKTMHDVAAYLDIGKKRHPSHLAVFEQRGDKKIMLHQKFMDGWDYKDQVAYCKQAIEAFDISWFEFDNTRGEFEAYIEDNTLPTIMMPCVHTVKMKGKMAGAFSLAVERKEVELIDSLRLSKSILAVTNDLEAVESVDGHGDSFWACAGAILGLSKPEGGYTETRARKYR